MAVLQIPPTLQMVKHDFIDKQAFKHRLWAILKPLVPDINSKSLSSNGACILNL